MSHYAVPTITTMNDALNYIIKTMDTYGTTEYVIKHCRYILCVATMPTMRYLILGQSPYPCSIMPYIGSPFAHTLDTPTPSTYVLAYNIAHDDRSRVQVQRVLANSWVLLEREAVLLNEAITIDASHSSTLAQSMAQCKLMVSLIKAKKCTKLTILCLGSSAMKMGGILESYFKGTDVAISRYGCRHPASVYKDFAAGLVDDMVLDSTQLIKSMKEVVNTAVVPIQSYMTQGNNAFIKSFLETGAHLTNTLSTTIQQLHHNVDELTQELNNLDNHETVSVETVKTLMSALIAPFTDVEAYAASVTLSLQAMSRMSDTQEPATSSVLKSKPVESYKPLEYDKYRSNNSTPVRPLRKHLEATWTPATKLSSITSTPSVSVGAPQVNRLTSKMKSFIQALAEVIPKDKTVALEYVSEAVRASQYGPELEELVGYIRTHYAPLNSTALAKYKDELKAQGSQHHTAELIVSSLV